MFTMSWRFRVVRCIRGVLLVLEKHLRCLSPEIGTPTWHFIWLQPGFFFEENTLLIPPENKVHFAEFGRIPFPHSCQGWSEHSCFTTVWGVKQNFWKLVLLAKSDSNGSDRLCLNDAIQSLASWKTCTSQRIVSASKPFNRPFRRCHFFLRMRFSFFAGRLSSPVVFSRPTTAQKTQYNYRVRDEFMCFSISLDVLCFKFLLHKLTTLSSFDDGGGFSDHDPNFNGNFGLRAFQKGLIYVQHVSLVAGCMTFKRHPVQNAKNTQNCWNRAKRRWFET